MATTTQPPAGSAADPLRPFVPRLAVDWLRAAPDERHRSFPGTLVFADVSGFTELTEKLSQRGRAGSEEIADVLDAAFAELVAAAYAYDADLLKWGGDAILLLFRGDGHTARAAAGASAMKRALAGMRRLSTSAGPVRLRMSIGAHAGVFHCFLVGSVHRELVVTGPDATITVETEAIARAGQIALSPAAAAAVAPDLVGGRRDGVVLLAGAPELEPVVPPFFDASGVDLARLLPAEYTLELRGSPGDPEHRHVAVGFVELRGTDELLEREGAEALAAELDDRIGGIQQACLRFGVTFAQTDISKGGVKAILLSGAPRSAGGDEEELLLRTARAVAEASGRLTVHVGLNAGRVFAGIVGPPTRRTYTFYGDAVNTAARIMARAAPGQVLARADVLERARTTYAVEPVEPFAAKGKAELVHAVSVGGAIGEREQLAAGPLVGRDEELTVLLAALERARGGIGGLTVIRGEAGLGKTRLLTELRAQAEDVRAVAVQCEQVDRSRPYAAVGTILRRGLQLGTSAPAGEAASRLRAAVTGRAPELTPWLPLLGIPLGLELPPTPETSRLDEQFVGERIAESVEALLAVLVPDTALVIVDDAHWLDEASGDVIGRITTRLDARPWLVAVARREQEGGFAVPAGTAATVVDLFPLGRSESEELVIRLTDDAPLGDHVVEGIALRSGGSPLFLTEIVRAVRGGGELASLPGSVESLLATQIDELPAGDRAALRQASVLGSAFELETLLATLELEPADGLALLRRLEDYLLLDDDGGVRFRHGLLREAAYEGLPYRRRRELHRRAGETLEARAGHDPGELAARLTHHFAEAGDWPRTVRYGWLAGKRAKDIYAYVDAIALLRRALEAGRRSRAVRPEDVGKIAEALADARVALGEFEPARSSYRAARRRVFGDRVERARLLCKEARCTGSLGRHADAQRLLQQALGLLDDVRSAPAAAQRARICAQRAATFQRQGRPREQLVWCRRAVAEAETGDAPDALATALFVLDAAHVALGEPALATNSQRALAIFDELGDLASKGGVLNNLGVLAYYAGNWQEALSLYERAAESWDEAGDRWSASFATFNVGEVLSSQGRYAEAESRLVDALRVRRAAGTATRAAEVLAELGRVHARRGDVAAALAHLEQARTAYADAGEQSGLLDVDARIAEAILLGGDAERALALAQEALDRCAAFPGGSFLTPVLLRIVACAHLGAGHVDAGREALLQSLKAAEALGADYEIAMTLDALTSLCRVAGGDAPTARRDELLERLGVVATPAYHLAA